MKLRIEKIEALPHMIDHPNGINPGYTKECEINTSMFKSPRIGKSFVVGTSFVTSVVTEILNTHMFRTMNSVYKWELIA